MNKEQFEVIFNLSIKQPWLTDNQEELLNLLFKDCSNDQQRELVVCLLNRFNYLTSADFENSQNQLCDRIVANSSLVDSSSQIVSMTADSSADSGQYILYNMKPKLTRRGWNKHLLVNRYDHSYKSCKEKGFQHKNIVLVDEFIGSGRTAINRINTIRSQYSSSGHDDIKFYVYAIAASSIGLKNLEQEGILYEVIHTIPQGISEHYSADKIEKKIELMIELEQILSVNYEGRAMPSLGYGKTESLYARDEGNTPNSVFPLFWWPYYSDNSERSNLLYRAMSDA